MMQGVFPEPQRLAFWSESREARVTELWAEGWSAALIGVELGVTRNAVIGKVRRLGLPMRVTARWAGPRAELAEKRAKKKAERDAARIRPKRTHMFQAQQVRQKLRADAPPVADMAIPIDQRKTLQELKKSSCRWPVGDPDREGFFFCGGVAEMDRPYCPAHARRAFQCW